LSSCAGSAPRGQPVAPVPAVVSHDGRYEGTVQVTGASMGVNQRDCQTTPRITIDVKDNRFSFAQPHPNVERSTPTLRDTSTPVYDATIRPDGTIVGISPQTNATMEGRVSGTRMSAQIYGLLCYYQLTADRV
jgi:hypothetical protein